MDAKIQVDTAPSGDRYVTLYVGDLKIFVEISAEGAVTYARVPAQNAEARGHATSAKAEAVAREKSNEPAPSVDPALADEPVTIARPSATIHGTLALPKGAQGPVPVVLLIAGSWPDGSRHEQRARPEDRCVQAARSGARPTRGSRRLGRQARGR